QPLRYPFRVLLQRRHGFFRHGMNAGHLLPPRREREVAAGAQQDRHDEEAGPGWPADEIRDAERDGHQQENAAEKQRGRRDAEAQRRRLRAARLLAKLDARQRDLLADERAQVVEDAANESADRFLNEIRIRHTRSWSKRGARENPKPQITNPNSQEIAPSTQLLGFGIWNLGFGICSCGGSIWMTTSTTSGKRAMSLSLTTCERAWASPSGVRPSIHRWRSTNTLSEAPRVRIFSQPTTPGTDSTTGRMSSSTSTTSSASTPDASRAICQQA